MQIRIDTKDFAKVESSLRAAGLDVERKAVPAALNKIVQKARTEMIRQISAEFALTQSEVRPRLRIFQASSKGGIFQASLDPFAGSRSRAMNLIRFVERRVSIAAQRKRIKAGDKQMRFMIRRGQGGKIIKGAFIGNRGRTVFQRVPGTTMSSRSQYSGTLHAEQIKPVQTISIPSMFNTRRISRAVISRINRELPIEMDRAILAAISGRLGNKRI